MRENGRSMVEMLGVLAIIGVLSVGAISGYSKAMLKYKLNKQAEQLNTVINAVVRHLHSFDDIINANGVYLNKYLVKLNEIPSEMVHGNDMNTIYDVFGIGWSILYTQNSSVGFINLSASSYPSLKTKSADNLEICRNMLVIAKENSGNIYAVSTISGHYTDESISKSLYGDGYCTSDVNCLKNITLEQVYNLCGAHWGTEKQPEFKINWLVKRF